MDFVSWALPCMGATLIITCSTIFRDARKLLLSRSPKLGELVICPMCTGFWVGVVSSSLGSSLQPDNFHMVLRLFADGCSSAFMCWAAHVTLCALGQSKYLSSRPDLREQESRQPRAA